MNITTHRVSKTKVGKIEEEKHENGDKYYVRDIFITEKNYEGVEVTHRITLFGLSQSSLEF